MIFTIYLHDNTIINFSSSYVKLWHQNPENIKVKSCTSLSNSELNPVIRKSWSTVWATERAGHPQCAEKTACGGDVSIT